MSQRAIPCLFLRGGTSRGPYFDRADLPAGRDALERVLIAAIGAGHPLCIDGLGGSDPVTAKLAMLSRGADGWAEIDFLFAQAQPAGGPLDWGPTCGNILAGVAPAALEMGLAVAKGEETRLRIRAVNTGARIEATLATPGGRVRYDGEARIDGVPGSGAPILLDFLDVAGARTGRLFPTGQAREVIDGLCVTCLDAAMPLVIARAADLGLDGRETPEALGADRALMARLERLRRAAGVRMGLGEVAASVTPKIGLVSTPCAGGALSARYFTPWTCHPSMAVSGAICLATAALAPGTVAEGLAALPADEDGAPVPLAIEHPLGRVEVRLRARGWARHGAIDPRETGIDAPGGFALEAAGVIRTARLLMRGEVMVPRAAWPEAG
jgi:2-methylaconitate cis-trans-isomerase PrpF